MLPKQINQNFTKKATLLILVREGDTFLADVQFGSDSCIILYTELEGIKTSDKLGYYLFHTGKAEYVQYKEQIYPIQ